MPLSHILEPIMYLKELCEQYLQHWEKESVKKDFCLRFPTSNDFISFLYSQASDTRISTLLSSQRGLLIVEESFHKHLVGYVYDLRSNHVRVA